MNWKAVRGYEGLYEVSDTGLVRSLDRTIECKGHLKLIKGKILSPRIVEGYLRVALCKGSSPKEFFVSQLVIEAFNPILLDEFRVTYIDGNKLNNSLENLKYTVRNGRRNSFPRPVRCVEDDLIFESLTSAAKHFNVTYVAISRAASNKGATCRKKHFEFVDKIDK